MGYFLQWDKCWMKSVGKTEEKDIVVRLAFLDKNGGERGGLG